MPAGNRSASTSEYMLLLKLRVAGTEQAQSVLISMKQLQRLDLEERTAGCLYSSPRAKKQVIEEVRAEVMRQLQEGRSDLYFPQSGWYRLPDGRRVFAAGDELLPGISREEAGALMQTSLSGITLAAPEDRSPEELAPEFLSSLAEHLQYRLPVFGYAIFSALRSLWKEVQLPFACALFIVGRSGTGKTTLARNFCQLYDKNGAPAEYLDAESTTSSLGEILHKTRDRTVLYDDICRTSNTGNQRKRLENGVKAVRYAANESSRMKMSGLDPQTHPCQAGLVLTAELLPQELSELTRCLLVQVHDYHIGGTARDRALAAGMLKGYLSWFARHCEQELENLNCARNSFPATPHPDVERLWRSFLQIDWCVESFLRFLQTLPTCRDQVPALKGQFEQCLMGVFSEEMDIIRQRQEQSGPIEKRILQGIRTGSISGFPYKGCFCARFEEIMACLRHSDHGISERMVSAYLREHGLVAQDGSERISKKVGGVRWVFLNEKFFRRAEG